MWMSTEQEVLDKRRPRDSPTAYMERCRNLSFAMWDELEIVFQRGMPVVVPI